MAEYSASSLIFTRDQIKSILNDFITLFTSSEFKAQLKSLSPHEEKIQALIELQQRNIFKNYNIDADRGFKDLMRIKLVYSNDPEIMRLLAFTALREETLVYEALGHIANPNLPSTPEQLESEFMKKMAEIQQLAMKVQENPQLLQTLDPGQLQMLKQMQAYMQQMQQMQQQNVAINMQFMQGPSINTMKK